MNPVLRHARPDFHLIDTGNPPIRTLFRVAPAAALFPLDMGHASDPPYPKGPKQGMLTASLAGGKTPDPVKTQEL